MAFWGGLLLLGGLWASKWLYPQIEPVVERVFLGMALATNGFDSARAFYSFEYRQFFILGVMLVASGIVLRVSRSSVVVPVPLVGKRPLWEPLAAVVIVLDLFLANWGFHAAVNPALLDYKPQLVQWLEQQPGLWRLTSFNPSGDIPVQRQFRLAVRFSGHSWLRFDDSQAVHGIHGGHRAARGAAL
jgi:hypothetical protein